MFPITYKRRFIYTVQGDPRLAAEKLRDHLAQGLAREGARQVIVEDRVIRFNGNPRSWGNRWHFFHAISKGKATVDYKDDRVGVVYQISFIDHFVLFLLFMGFAGFISFGLPGTQFWSGLRFFVMAFCWFGLSISVPLAINCYRFNRFMKDRLHEFFNSTSRFGAKGELITSR